MKAREFSFRGEIPASKSVLIRALLMKAYSPELTIRGGSRCDDVMRMKSAVQSLHDTGRANCGEAGLVLRLMIGYASRQPGEWILEGSPRLMTRPHGPLLDALRALGVESIQISDRELKIQGLGWKKPHDPIRLDPSLSSQYLTSLILNSWDLDFPLEIDLIGDEVSVGYREISTRLARDLGMRIEMEGARLRIPSAQKIDARECLAPADLSSAFSVAALAAIAGRAEFTPMVWDPSQPDHAFSGILERMGVRVEHRSDSMIVEKHRDLRSIEVDLENSPDLFPVLSVLCAFADGRSRLFGAPHLRHKESDRIAASAELVKLLGRKVSERDDGMEIEGRPVTEEDHSRRFEFDPHQDHRLVMAAAVARWAGVPVIIHDLRAVQKSFPEFLEIAGLGSAG